MMLIPNFAVNILSGRLKPKARKWRMMLIISIIAFLVMPYTLSRIFAEGIMTIVVLCIIVGLVIFLAVIFKYFIDKYEVIGKIVFNSDRITIKTPKGINPIELKNIKEIYFEFFGYLDQPFKYGPKMRTENGNQNFITIKTIDETLRYELFLESSRMLKALTNYLEYYKNNNIKIIIINI
jgi:hypothetical protein